MKVIERKWHGGDKVYDLEDLLSGTLQSQDSERGALEDVEKKVSVMADTVGKVLAILVEKRILALNEVYSLCGGYADITEVKE